MSRNCPCPSNIALYNSYTIFVVAFAANVWPDEKLKLYLEG